MQEGPPLSIPALRATSHLTTLSRDVSFHDVEHDVESNLNTRVFFRFKIRLGCVFVRFGTNTRKCVTNPLSFCEGTMMINLNF